MMTDPIADLLTRIRNALLAGHDQVSMPTSKVKAEIARILRDEGYIRDFRVVDRRPQGVLEIRLKYGPSGERVINGLERVSKPGRRVYRGKTALPRVLGGLGISIVSTSQGILEGRAARQRGVGGEVLCNVW
jgi:small subunit ribosomal protein S8